MSGCPQRRAREAAARTNAAPTVEIRHQLKFAPELHQRHALEAVWLFPVVWLCGGLGAGKTWLLVWYSILMTHKWAPGVDGLIVEPDYDTFRDAFLVLWRDIMPGEGELWEMRNSVKLGRHLWVRGPNGVESHIYVRSAHNEQYVRKIDSLTTIGWAGLDEPSRMQCGKRAFELTLARLRSQRMQTLGWPHNPLLVVGVPAGFNWLAEDVFGCTEDHPEHGYRFGYVTHPKADPTQSFYIRACRTKDNARNLYDRYEANARLVYSETLANQMFTAALTSSQGMIFPEWSKALHVIPNALADRLWQERVVRPIGGMDWGFTAPAATEIMCWTRDHELLVADEWYHRGRQVHEQGAWAQRAIAKWAKRTDQGGRPTMPFFGDPSGNDKIDLLRMGFDHTCDVRLGCTCGAEPPEEAIRHVIDCHPAQYHGASNAHASAPEGWQGRIDHMRNLLTPRLGVQHPNFSPEANPGCPRILIAERCENLIAEMGKYRQKQQKGGQPDREGATGDDHGIDCVTGAAYTTDVMIQPSGGTRGRGVARGHRRAA